MIYTEDDCVRYRGERERDSNYSSTPAEKCPRYGHIRETYFAIGMTGVIHCIGYLTVKISIGKFLLCIILLLTKHKADIENDRQSDSIALNVTTCGNNC